MKIKIATRDSPLALWQANYVAMQIQQRTECEIELVKIKTLADKFLGARLQKIGGKGLFVKELEAALLSRECDLAVHSMKDVPTELPLGLKISAILTREDPRDCFVSAIPFSELESGVVIGTSSLRRACQLLHFRSDLKVVPIRGNIQTRLAKLKSGEVDAVLLAAAGLYRLGLSDSIQYIFKATEMIPAVGQGAIGIETCDYISSKLSGLLTDLTDQHTTICVQTERKVTEILSGNCHLPVAAHAEIVDDQLKLVAMVGSFEPVRLLYARQNGPIDDPLRLGTLVASELLRQGAQTFLDKARSLHADL